MFRITIPEKSGNLVVPSGMAAPVGQLGPGSYRLEVTALDGVAKSVTRAASISVRRDAG